MNQFKLASIFLILLFGVSFLPVTASTINPREPQRIILNWSGSPSTSMSVTWRTLDAVNAARVQVHPAGPSPLSPAGAAETAAVSALLDIGKNRSVWTHSARLIDLTPDTLYDYRVGSEDDWSEWSQFRTAAATPTPFRFIYLGDTQNDLSSQCSRVLRASLMRAPDARFILHAGDLVTRAHNDQLWGDWFRAGGWIYRTIPQIMVPGNHEYYPVIPLTGKGLTPLWRPHFTLPENGPDGLEETAYVLDIQGVRLVALNPNEKLEAQAEWLGSVLKHNPNWWTILLMHQPLYSTGRERDNVELRNLLLPVIDANGVDLVLAGHDHTYGRTHRLYGGRVVSPEHPGTVYVVSVAGPKQYGINPKFKSLMVRMGADKQFFQTLEIREKVLKYVCRTADGVLFDEFELHR